MAVSTQCATILITLYLFQYLSGSYSTIFTIVNNCSYTVWPAILSGVVGTSALSTTGFALQPGESNAITVPLAWSGLFWGRTLCSEESTGKFSCITGDCGSSTLGCAGGNATLPVTVAKFTLNGAGGLDHFDVSLVNGYNLPMMVEPQGRTGAGNCIAAGCEVELNAACPIELQVMSGGEVVGCKSPCEAFGDLFYCCTGAYASPETCKPNPYSLFFKSVCPRIYSYAYDNATSTFTCASADFRIIFCPTHSSSPTEPVKGKVDNSEGQSLILIILAAVVGALVTSCCSILLRFFIMRICGIDVPVGV